jgi:hypothetical protein
MNINKATTSQAPTIKLKRRWAAVILAVLVAVVLSGCSMGSFGLTADKDLQGERTEGESSYVGDYTTDYRKFSGSETVFGGTDSDSKKLHITGSANNASGKVSVTYETDGSDPVVIPLKDGKIDAEFTARSSTYIKINAEQYTGHLELKSEQEK